jgi:hypothetical protein
MRSKSIFALVLATALVATPAAIRAAPDHTLGMALMSAIVTAGGDLVGGAGAVSSVSTALTGYYEVKFNRNLQGCSCAAMHVGESTLFSRINVTAFCPTLVESDTVAVRTWQTANDAAEDRPFHLIVFCPK